MLVLSFACIVVLLVPAFVALRDLGRASDRVRELAVEMLRERS